MNGNFRGLSAKYISEVGVLLSCLTGCSVSHVDNFREMLLSSESEVRIEALRELDEDGRFVPELVPELRQCAASDEVDLRRLAARCLRHAGEQAEPAIAALTELLNDSEHAVRLAAAFSLLELRPADEAAVAELTGTMASGEGGTIVAVGRMGADAGWAVPTLITVAGRDRRPGIRRLAVDALGSIAPHDSDVQATLTQRLDDPDDRVREAAQHALTAASTH